MMVHVLFPFWKTRFSLYLFCVVVLLTIVFMLTVQDVPDGIETGETGVG